MNLTLDELETLLYVMEQQASDFNDPPKTKDDEIFFSALDKIIKTIGENQ